MLSKTDIERERYEARMKAQRDINTNRWFDLRRGAINAFERLLGRPESTPHELEQLSPDELNRLSQDLEKQVQTRR